MSLVTETSPGRSQGSSAQGGDEVAAMPDSNALALRDEVLMPASPAAAKAAMDAYQTTTAAILDSNDWQGQPGRAGSFVKKSGWRKIAKAYKLSTSIVSVAVERDPNGVVSRASAIVRATHVPSGQFSEGDGYCSVDEPRFDRQSGRHKLENDLRATATTRAKNRAIADLVGMGAVSAEEADTNLAFGPPMSQPDAVYDAVAKFGILAGVPRIDAEAKAVAVVEWLEGQHGYLPAAVGRALIKAQREIEKVVDPADVPWSRQYGQPPEDEAEVVEGEIIGEGTAMADEPVTPQERPEAETPDPLSDDEDPEMEAVREAYEAYEGNE